MLQDVPVPPLAVAGLEPVIGPERYTWLVTAATDFRARLGQRTVWNISSTAMGGGVAEMLRVLVGYAHGLGIPVRWTVISGDPEFFAITKRLHNQIHGQGSAQMIGGADARHYEQVLAANSDELLERVRPGDIALLHDPQTAGLTAPLAGAGVHVVWRSHIGVDFGERCDPGGLGLPAEIPGHRAGVRLHAAATRSAPARSESTTTASTPWGGSSRVEVSVPFSSAAQTTKPPNKAAATLSG